MNHLCYFSYDYIWVKRNLVGIDHACEEDIFLLVKLSSVILTKQMSEVTAYEFTLSQNFFGVLPLFFSKTITDVGYRLKY